ncbi:MAG: putative toxin-antitoxin system toxin component, PIN family [Patescibacteria group bacterium]
MKKKQKNLKVKVLFNASVVLSGINSPNGGSAVLLNLVKAKKINGIISEIILDEILRHAPKFGQTRDEISNFCLRIFSEISSAPNEREVKKYFRIVIDDGDAHVLASCEKEKVNFLVTLDKKHLLILKGKIKGLNIYTPGELIELLNKN